jgi:hypothetical protein
MVPGSRRTAVQAKWETELWFPGYGRAVKVRQDGSKVSLELDDLPTETALRVLDVVYGLTADAEPMGIGDLYRVPVGTVPAHRPSRVVRLASRALTRRSATPTKELH